jgi:hypothetical protein
MVLNGHQAWDSDLYQPIPYVTTPNIFILGMG